jgi:hypothetical protein
VLWVAVLLVATAPVRVYLAPLRVSGADADSAALVQDRVLVAASQHRDEFDVVSEGDLKGLLAAEADKQAVGCSSDSCAAEIADALSAPQLVTGQLVHTGELWQLTLTRVEREQMKVLARVTASAEGDTPAPLLPRIGALVSELFGVAVQEAPISPLAIGAGATAGVGAAALLVGGALFGVSWNRYFAARDALAGAHPDVATATDARDLGVATLRGSWVAWGIGAVAVATGGALFAVDVLTADE